MFQIAEEFIVLDIVAKHCTLFDKARKEELPSRMYLLNRIYFDIRQKTVLVAVMLHKPVSKHYKYECTYLFMTDIPTLWPTFWLLAQGLHG